MIGRKIWSALMVRGPKRGTWAHQLGGIFAAIVVGVAFWWARATSGT